MKKNILAATLISVLLVPLAAQAGKAEYQAAYAQALAAHEQAGAHQWLVTSQALTKAKKAAEKGNYDEAGCVEERRRSLVGVAAVFTLPANQPALKM